MAEETSSIRSKRGGVEFEMVGSAADVAKAWDALGEVVTDAFKSPVPPPDPGGGSSGGGEGGGKKKTSRRGGARKKAAAAGDSGGARSNIKQKLLDADVDEFPEIGDSASARHAGYAVLSWAKKVVGEDGLTAGEIAEFLEEQFGIPNTPQAYRQAFKGRAREVKRSGSPAVYKLMKDGQRSLDAHVAKVAAGTDAAQEEGE